MASDKEGKEFIGDYGLKNAKLVSDKKMELYQAFGLVKGKFNQLFNKESLARGKAAQANGHNVSMPKGNVFQMPGVFLVKDGLVVKEFRHKHVGELPDYEEMSTCPLPQ